MNKIIIAPKREFRHLIDLNWQNEISKIKGVRVLVREPQRLRLEATPEAVQELRARLESTFNIEQMVMHYKMA